MPGIVSEGHPEIFTLASEDKRVREAAVKYTTKTIYFAAEMGAKLVVLHCGNVDMKHETRKLLEMCQRGKRLSNSYEKAKLNVMLKREKRVKNHLIHLQDGLEMLTPVLARTGIRLGLENLPSWESIPTEIECIRLIENIGRDYLCYWHDIGHAQIKENLGFHNHLGSLSKLQPYLGGMHIHDVVAPAQDHLIPSMGNVDFNAFRQFLSTGDSKSP